MRKFEFDLSNDLVLKYKQAMLNNDMDISQLVVYMQQVKEEKKKQAGNEERRAKKARSADQDIRQQQGDNKTPWV